MNSNHQTDIVSSEYYSADNLTELANNLEQVLEIVETLQEKDFIVKTIANLINQNNMLHYKFEQEKYKLKQRNHELSVLYNTSSALGYFLSYEEISFLTLESLYPILNYEFCSIFLYNSPDRHRLYMKLSPYLQKSFVKELQKNVFNNAETFLQKQINSAAVITVSEQISEDEAVEINGYTQNIKSFLNIPLSFKGEIIGLACICSIRDKAFSREKISFAYTMANQTATVVGRLNQLVESEKKRISHLIEQLEDAIIVIDADKQPLSLNNHARQLIGCDETNTHTKFMDLLNRLTTNETILNAVKHNTKLSGLEITLRKDGQDLIFLVNVDPIYSSDSNFFTGTAISLKDISYLKKIEKEKTEKIAIINKARELITSIANQEKLFSILGDYILNVANADMGALYLLHKNNLSTKSSWVLPIKDFTDGISEFEANFPESNEFITLTTGENLLKKTLQAKQTLIFRDIPLKKDFLMHNASHDANEIDIVLKELITIPLLTKEKAIGILTVIRKNKPDVSEFSKEDIETLETIVSLSASAIENAYLYERTLNEQKMQQELKLAHEIQKRILPKKVPQSKNFEYGGVSIPARGIGGDYYDFFQVNKASTELTGITIVDVVGKGIPAALITIMIKSIIQMNVQGNASPKDVIKHINQAALNEPAITKFIPMFYCIVNDQTNNLTYTNAGHEVPMVFRARENEFFRLDTEGFPVGGMEDVDYEEKNLLLRPGDIVSISTDGIVEARNPDGEEFGTERLMKYIRMYKHLPANKIVDKIYTNLINFVKDAPQHDDITLVIVKAKDHHGENIKTSRTVIWEKELKINSATHHVKTVRDVVEEASKKLDFTTSTIYDIKLAVNEAQANIIKHAYNKAPDQPIEFKVTVFEDRIEYYFKDYGKTFGELSIKQTRSLDDFQGNGLGVFLIKSTMDEVTYNIDPGKGTELLMIKFSEMLENTI